MPVRADEPKAVASPLSTAAPAIAPWGVDLNHLQKSTHPGDDFYKFANGNWTETAKLADGEWITGSRDDAKERTEQTTKRLIDRLLQRSWPAWSDEAKFVKIYQSYLNRTRANGLGRRPINTFLDQIKRARSHSDIAKLMGDYQLGAGGLFSIIIRIDPEGEKAYVPSLEQTDLLLGLPLTYLRDEPHLQAQRVTGTKLLDSLMIQAGQRWRNQSRVQAVLQLETKIAALYPSTQMLRDVSQNRVFMSLEELMQRAPDFPWQVYFQSAGIGQTDRVHIRVWQSLDKLAGLFHETPVAVWRDYLRLRLISEYGDFLADRIADNSEALEALRRNVPFVREDIETRAAGVAQRFMPDVLGRAYLQENDHSAQIEDVTRMAEAIRDAFRVRIRQADWLSVGTRDRALTKLAAVRFIIGGPPGWNDYKGYEAFDDELFINAYLARQQRQVAALRRLGGPQDQPREDVDVLRSRVFFSPLQVGAYYLPRLNTVIIPANYLQAPFYDPHADMAVNFGALGSTIGHELGHAFDDQGSKYGPAGQLQEWWSTEDRAQFEALGAQLSAQFANYEAVPGIRVNTALTLGENLSDLAGLEIGYAAYESMRQKQTGDKISKQEGARRFLLGYTQKRRSFRHPHVAFEFALTGAHSPPEHRVNGIVRNLDFWYEAYGVGPEHKLWLDPKDRVSIW